MKKLTKKQIKNKEKRELNKIVAKWKVNILKRDNLICQKCKKNLDALNKKGNPIRKHPHHIISFESVKRNYPKLISDLNNGILLCAQCHKFFPDSAHEGGFEFTYWLKKTRPKQYNYLLKKIKDKFK